MKVIKPPEQIPNGNYHSIFLAGSIDLGKAEDWQTELTKVLSEIDYFKNTVIFNPRRDDWDSSWEQTLENKEFVGQVTWELDALDKSTVIILVFTKESQSPISLLELGLHAKANKMLVCCPDEYWRSGNVYVVCERYGIKYVKSFEQLLEKLKELNK